MQRPSRLLELTQHHALLPAARQAPPLALTTWSVYLPAWGRSRCSGEHQKQRKERQKQAIEGCVEVLACYTRVDVPWQDGTRDTDGPATAYAPANTLMATTSSAPGLRGRQGGHKMSSLRRLSPLNPPQRISVVTWRGSMAVGPNASRARL